MTSEQVFLKIEDTEVLCEKQILIKNSEYFRVIFQGDFVESEKITITLQDVDLHAISIILKFLTNESLHIRNEDVLVVLETACMLLFENIKIRCIEQIRKILCPTNCLQIWRETERQQIRPLFLHAKTMALEEFLITKDTEYILDMSLKELCNYLGDIYLKTDTEYSVFLTAMKWWERNKDLYRENHLEILLKLLSCIHWPTVLNNNLKLMMMFRHIADKIDIMYILCYILLFKNHMVVEHFSTSCKDKAVSLLNCKGRRSPVVPCILVNFMQSKNEEPIPRSKTLMVIYYDYTLRKFRKYFDFGDKATNRYGFALMGRKECAFLFGGEYGIGSGNWHRNLWMYNTYRESWYKKAPVPFQRRHFQTCLVNDNLYVIGGTGLYRVKENDMFWYNFNEDQWKGHALLPLPGIQLKCCNFLNQLLLVNLWEKCGFLFNDQHFDWSRIDIIFSGSILSSLGDYCVFSYNNFLYIKGNYMLRFAFVNCQLKCENVTYVRSEYCERQKLVLCNNFVFTLYEQRVKDNFVYTLESFDLDNSDFYYIFENKPCDSVIDIDGDLYILNSTLKMFSFQHHSLVEQTDLINEAFA